MGFWDFKPTWSDYCASCKNTLPTHDKWEFIREEFAPNGARRWKYTLSDARQCVRCETEFSTRWWAVKR